MMNETGQYPGLVMAPGCCLTFLLAMVPFIPILRDSPRWIPIHRLIWRRSSNDV